MHIPFCRKKCNYCDFYSSFVTEELLDIYTESLISSIKKWGGELKNRPIDTIYLGGGTPSLLEHRLVPVLDAVKTAFNVKNNAEITLELNPSAEVQRTLNFAKLAGVNRLSIGAQSGIDEELKLLGRTHTATDTRNTVALARKSGISNISLDIMIGLPHSTENSLNKSLEFVKSLSPEHISAYILKIEQNTVFAKREKELCLPCDDLTADQYLYMCIFLEKNGYTHYEISNFCKENAESRHNIKYWQGKEYLGLGPAAHSYLNGKRFYYPRDLKAFIKGNAPLPDGEGGGKQEYIMLGLRLKDGINTSQYSQKFGEELSNKFYQTVSLFEKKGLLKQTNENIYLTNSGMLLSNTVISSLLECLE